MPATGKKQKLRITTCLVNKGVPQYDKNGNKFECMINPSSYQQTSGISYRKVKPLGGRTEEKFDKYEPEKFSFKDFILDGTGVVAGATEPVKNQVKQLRMAAYNYVNKENDSPIVHISWGPLSRFARLDSITVDYTLFKPNGEPLRAKVNLSFRTYTSSTEFAKLEAREEAEKGQVVETKNGDTLANLCQEIYGDSKYYLEVAKFNNLSSISNIKPGTVLRFPPRA